MTAIQIPSYGDLFPSPLVYNSFLGSTAFDTTTNLFDATGEKVALIGRHWNRTRSTKNIRKVGFLFGSVTKAGGSGLTVSLQDVDLANGPAMRPDETQDQTVAIANGNATFASSTWCLTGALSADRSVAHGEHLAVVFEFDGSGRQGADTVAIACGNVATNVFAPYQTQVTFKAAGSWSSNVGKLPLIAFEYDDGTYGGFSYCVPASARVTIGVWKSDSTPDEYAIEFVAPFTGKCDGAWASVFVASHEANLHFILYDSANNVLGSTTVDANAIQAANAYMCVEGTWPEAQITKGATYRLAVKPTTTTASSTAWAGYDIPSTAYKSACPVPDNWGLTSRTDGGSWAAVTETRIPHGGLRISTRDDGAGGAGGGGIKLAGRGGLAG